MTTELILPQIKPNGWLIIDKTAGVNSTPAVAMVRRLLAADKAGHAGTLDGFASGVLPIALGRATKLVPLLMEADKDYVFTLAFGVTSPSLELSDHQITTLEVPSGMGGIVTPDRIEAVLPHFMGRISQLPPHYSALKLEGMRASDRVRAGEEIALKPRPIMIKELRLIGWLEPWHWQGKAFPQAKLFVRCGKGTYVRALARDIAAKLASVALVTSLRRTRVGEFSLAKAISLERLLEMRHKPPALADGVKAWVLSAAQGLDGTPVYELTDESQRASLQKGQPLSLFQTAILADNLAKTKGVRIDAVERLVITHQGQAHCLCQWRDGRIWPYRQLA